MRNKVIDIYYMKALGLQQITIGGIVHSLPVEWSSQSLALIAIEML